MAYTMASASPRLIIEPENTASPGLRVAGKDSPVNADWSTCTGSPANRRASAGTMSPKSQTDDVAGHQFTIPSESTHFPSRRTRALVASLAFNAAISLPA